MTAIDPITDLPFPLASFPPDVGARLETTAAHARVPVACIAFPLLAVTGAVLGNQVTLQVGPGWSEWPALRVALVAPTGHGKAPAIAAARAQFTTLHGTSCGEDAEVDAILDELAAQREQNLLRNAGNYQVLPEHCPGGVAGSGPEHDSGGSEAEDGEDSLDDHVDDALLEGSPLFITTTRLDHLTRTQLQQRLGRPDLSRFNRAIDWLTARATIKTATDTFPGRKPVTRYRQVPPPHGVNP